MPIACLTLPSVLALLWNHFGEEWVLTTKGGAATPHCPLQNQHTSRKGRHGPHIFPIRSAFLMFTSVLASIPKGNLTLMQVYEPNAVLAFTYMKAKIGHSSFK